VPDPDNTTPEVNACITGPAVVVVTDGAAVVVVTVANVTVIPTAIAPDAGGVVTDNVLVNPSIFGVIVPLKVTVVATALITALTSIFFVDSRINLATGI
jgi:hypothetical protein